MRKWSRRPADATDWPTAPPKRLSTPGNPNGPNLPGWPAFEAPSQTAMEFGEDAIPAARKNARPAFCDLDASALKSRLNEAWK